MHFAQTSRAGDGWDEGGAKLDSGDELYAAIGGLDTDAELDKKPSENKVKTTEGEGISEAVDPPVNGSDMCTIRPQEDPNGSAALVCGGPSDRNELPPGELFVDSPENVSPHPSVSSLVAHELGVV